jgi:hypothetical protein
MVRGLGLGFRVVRGVGVGFRVEGLGVRLRIQGMGFIVMGYGSWVGV